MIAADFWTGPVWPRLVLLACFAVWSLACVCIGFMVQNAAAQRDYRRRMAATRARAFYDYDREEAA